MKLIVISSNHRQEDEPKLITEMFHQGLEYFHLRKNRLSTKLFAEYIEQIPQAFHNRIMIHSHHNLAMKFKLKGIHLGRYHRKRKFRTWLKRKILTAKNPGIIISTSFRKLESVYDDKGKYDYVFLAPVFDTLSGKYQSGFTEHALKAANSKTIHTLIARGGIKTDTIGKVHELGFAGIAFQSWLWNKKDPVKEFIAVLDEFKRLGITKE